MSESRSTMSHIQTKRNVPVKHILYALYHLLGRTCFMLPSPVIEPTAPEFTAHQRRVGPQLLQLLKFILDIGSSTEIYSPQQIFQSIVRKITTPIALKQRYLCKSRFPDQIPDRCDIGLINPVRAILIFHLYHNDIPASSDL